MVETWFETDALLARRATEHRDAVRGAQRLAYQAAYTAARRTGATKDEAHQRGVEAFTAANEPTEAAAARPALTVVPDEPADDCVSGSCQLARPGGPCDCACGGTQHGARSTLTPAACHGTKVLADRAPQGGYRYVACPGCSACTRPRLVLVASSRDPFARIPQTVEEAW